MYCHEDIKGANLILFRHCHAGGLDHTTPGRFGPIPDRSGRISLGCFGPISWVSRSYLFGVAFSADFRGESFRSDIFLYV